MLAQVLVTTDEKNYTANDALQLLKDLNLTQQVGASSCAMPLYLGALNGRFRVSLPSEALAACPAMTSSQT